MNMSFEDVKLICNGALGSLTFGGYHFYYTTSLINENNSNNDFRMNELKKDYDDKINNLLQKIEKIEKKSKWFFF